MFFNNSIDDDNESSQNKSFNISKYTIPLIIIGGILFLVIIILVFTKLFNVRQYAYEEKLYYITLLGETNMTLYLHEELI